MVDNHIERIDWGALGRVAADVDTGEPFDAAAVRSLALELWRSESLPAEADRRRRRVLMGLRSPYTAFASGEQLRDLVVDGFWAPYFAASTPLMERALASLGRQCIAPFRAEDLVRVLRALLDGLQGQSTMEPGSVTAELYANVLTGLLVTLTVPVGRDESLADVEAALRGPSRRADTTDMAQLRATAISALGLFDRDVTNVTFSQVAAVTGMSIDALIQQFGTVRRVAAMAFAQVLARVQESATRHLSHDPMRALADTLCDIARMAQQHPHVAAALLYERSEQAVSGNARSTASRVGVDIRAAVPLSIAVAGVLGAVAGSSGVDVDSLAADMVDLTLLYAGTRSSWAPADVARRAVSLLPT
jgi:hypothetical protein